jgi:hypothetical protein
MSLSQEIIAVLEYTFQALGRLAETFTEVFSHSLSQETTSGLVGLFCVVLILRVANGGARRVKEVVVRSEQDEHV